MEFGKFCSTNVAMNSLQGAQSKHELWASASILPNARASSLPNTKCAVPVGIQDRIRRDPPHAAVLLASAHLLSHDSQGASFFLVLIGCRPLLVMLETLDQELAQFFLVLVNKKCQGKAEHFCTLLASQHLAFCKPIGGGQGSWAKPSVLRNKEAAQGTTSCSLTKLSFLLLYALVSKQCLVLLRFCGLLFRYLK